MKESDKKAQMKLSFGMIFSIILIIIFVALAFYVIYKFVGIQKNAEIGIFVDNLQGEVDKMWKSSKGSKELEHALPSKITDVCFTDTSEIYFKPAGSGGNFDYIEIDHINDANIENEICFKNIDGKVKIVLEKNYGEVLVNVARP